MKKCEIREKFVFVPNPTNKFCCYCNTKFLSLKSLK